MRIILLAALLTMATVPLCAQSLTFRPKNSAQPIEVTAENGLELQQDAKRAIARGNARLAQGDVSVVGDVIMADYREGRGGDNEIYRVFATGNVTMKSASETATGAAAVYDINKGVLVLEGELVTLVSKDGTVTAHKTLQYWSKERVAVAEGNASAGDTKQRQIQGDKLIAFFREDGTTPMLARGKPQPPKALQPRGQSDINYVQAFGNVRLQTPTEIIRSERGSYNIDTGIATLEGGVQITRDKNQLSGGFAVVNVRGGISKVYANPTQAGMSATREHARIKALLAPSTKPASTPPDGADAARPAP